MRRVPILTEVVLRAWGTDDPRTLTALRDENQPARTYRARIVERRALDAGWPVIWMEDARKAATAAAERLDGMSFGHRGQSRASARRRFAVADQEAYRRRKDETTVTWDGADPATIFDE